MYHQGDVYLADLDPIKGSEQAGMRPVVVVSGESFNSNKNLVIVCPATSKIHYGDLIVDPSPTNGFTERTEILSFQIRTITTQRLTKKIGSLSDNEIKNILAGITDILTY